MVVDSPSTRRFLRALALVLVVGLGAPEAPNLTWLGAASADDEPGRTRRPRRPKRDGFDFGTDDAPARPGESTQPRGGDDDAARPGTPRVDPIQAEIARLRRWPARSAQLAAESLYLRGQEAVPALLRILKDGEPSLQPGCAVVLGRIGESVHVQTILSAAARRRNGHRAREFFDAAWNLDPKSTKKWLIGFLPITDRPIFRSLASQFLATRVTEDDKHRVMSLLDATKAPVRAAALELLEPAGVEDAEARLIAALSDVSPQVSRRAALLVGLKMNGDLAVRLNDLARSGDARERAYATLALVEAMRAGKTNPFEQQTLVELSGRRGLLHPDKMNRASAAAGLAFGALDGADSAIGALLDSTVMDVLVESIGGSHFADYGSFQDACFAALKRLSGRVDLPETAVAWARWWREARTSFRARRPLREISAASLRRAYVTFSAVRANGRKQRATFVSENGLDRRGALLLTGEAFEALVNSLEHAGIFEAEGGDVPQAEEHIRVSLGVADQRKTLILFPGGEAPDSARYMQMQMRFASLLEANVWQRYRDHDRNPDAKAWWRTNAPLMAEASPEERELLLQAAIVYAYDDLRDEDERAEALDRLRAMNTPLSRPQMRDLARNLASDPAFGDLEADALTWLATQAGPQVREDVIDALAERVEPRALEILSDLLSRSGIERVRKAYEDVRPGMRAAAARASRKTIVRLSGGDPEIARQSGQFAALEPGLEVLSLDDEPAVAVQALLARAWLGHEGTATELEKIYKGSNLGVRISVTEALGDLPGGQGHPLLTLIVGDERGGESARLRATALQSMARSQHANAVRLLSFFMLNDKDPSVRRAASQALIGMGTPDARFALVDPLVRDQLSGMQKALTLKTLSAFRGDVVTTMLKRYLGDSDLDVAAEAAIGAAQHDIGGAVPTLITLLRRGTADQRTRAVRALQTLTSRRFEEQGFSILAERYEAWYERNRAGGPRRWFRDALRAKAYEVGPLGPWMEGESDFAPIPIFIRVLRDADPVLRRNANRAIQHLTQLTYGDVTRGTSSSEAARIADRWSQWWDAEGRKRVGAGGR